ncbi:hypothetical protein [Lactiplantibacillus plantarum]|uniref:hypothetical protein n=1 Tax=Lactiplantibacillus plantarum TaxID=1590 RepID=UPI000482A36C|nr:hypothetical protein [Lactiplantibacillus plantarum]ANJ12740.1 hypothetical protein A8704_01350 [Lactiplantibacillus plantarum]KAF1281823.1 hypothetical protein CHF38_13975 [Lactiplantibacillus plantarum]MBT9656990.1 hypothetical protein [Lactiplantibacillus plantarum]MCB7178219.1 hypothetical protein [Lactiplantibacillus plantarum]MCF1425649.1 hypothetical protein [Lactiplantibacillus plantarum]
MKWQEMQLLRDTKYSSSENLKKFEDVFKFDKCAVYERPHSLEKLLAGDRSYNAGNKYDTPPYLGDWLDHAELQKVSGTTRIVAIAHDYGPADSVHSKIAEHVLSLDLVGVIFDSKVDWYYPGQSSLVMIMSRETYNYYYYDLLANHHVVDVVKKQYFRE